MNDLIRALCDSENQPHQWMDAPEEAIRQALGIPAAEHGAGSWLADPGVELRELRWHDDDFGAYWIAEAWRGGRKVGFTGSYYDIGENGQRASRDEQAEELRQWGKENLNDSGRCPDADTVYGLVSSVVCSECGQHMARYGEAEGAHSIRCENASCGRYRQKFCEPALALARWPMNESAADAYEKWKRDPGDARPYTEFRAELIAEGVLDNTEGAVEYPAGAVDLPCPFCGREVEAGLRHHCPHIPATLEGQASVAGQIRMAAALERIADALEKMNAQQPGVSPAPTITITWPPADRARW